MIQCGKSAHVSGASIMFEFRGTEPCLPQLSNNARYFETRDMQFFESLDDE